MNAVTLPPALKERIAIAVGQRLKRLRLERGLTQQAIADRTGIHRPIVARIESGRNEPSLQTLYRYAAALGVPVTDVASAIDAVLAGTSTKEPTVVVLQGGQRHGR